MAEVHQDVMPDMIDRKQTVKEHIQNLMRKLDVKDRTEAAMWALKKRLD
jgi:DNA-binding NarL/FixJ family response regulator